MQPRLTIGALARAAGCTASALRYYERQGLIRPQRLANGYRTYPEEAVRALRFLQQAKAYGLSLDEIKEILDIERGGVCPCGRVRVLLLRKRSAIEGQLQALLELKRRVEELLNRAQPSPDPKAVCPLIEEGNAAGQRAARTAQNPRRRDRACDH